VREEHNLDGPPETLEAVVEGLGFSPAWCYEKYRTRYRKLDEPGVIELDETPIGVYLELEGPPEWIDRTSIALGFSQADYVTASYGELFAAWQNKRAAPPRDMVFQVEAG
jgi:adenylate cyclase class 2